ncbi:hypothetical protein Ndes2526A_g07859 [Nannochloris sp. 'desiccata']
MLSVLADIAIGASQLCFGCCHRRKPIKKKNESSSHSPSSHRSPLRTFESSIIHVKVTKSRSLRASNSQSGCMPITVAKAATLAVAKMPRHIRTPLFKAPFCALDMFGKASRIFAPIARFTDVSPASGGRAMVVHKATAPPSSCFSPVRPSSCGASVHSSTDAHSGYSKNCWQHQMLFTSNINYTCFQVAQRLGFTKLATGLLNQSVIDIGSVLGEILEGSSAMAPEDQLVVVDFSLELSIAQQEWAPCLKEKNFSFIQDEQSLVYAVCFILNLAAGILPYNKKTRELLIESCVVVKDFTDDYHHALKNWDLLASTPLGMSPFYGIKEFVIEALDVIELEKPLWFEQEEGEGLFKAVRGLNEAVLATGVLLKKERKVEPQLVDVSWMESIIEDDQILQLDEEEADIAVFMAAFAGGVSDSAGGVAGADGSGGAAQSAFDFGFNMRADSATGSNPKASRRPSKDRKASKFGSAFGSSAANTAAPVPEPTPAAAGHNAEGAPPTFGFTASDSGASTSSFVFASSAATSAEGALPIFSFNTSANISGENAAPAPAFTFGLSSGSTASPTTADATEDVLPACTLNTSLSEASASGFIFGSTAATSVAAGSSAEGAAPELKYNGGPVSTAGVEHQGPGESTSGESTPMSESGSVFGFGASADGASRSGQSTRARRCKPKK